MGRMLPKAVAAAFLVYFSYGVESETSMVPLTRHHAEVRELPETVLTQLGMLPWKADKLDTVGQAACLKAVATNGTDRYITAEGGIVLKGSMGMELSTILNAGFPQYYYGVGVIGDTVVVTGFVDGVGVSNGIARSSTDGGKTWGNTTIVSKTTWITGAIRTVTVADTKAVRVVVPSQGTQIYVNDGFSTTHAGSSQSWKKVAAGSGPNAGWHAGPYVVSGSELVLAGVQLCRSTDSAGSFACTKPIDPVFDGGIAMSPKNSSIWVTGGGTISPSLTGWLHHSADGGKTWSTRVLQAPYPIRYVGFACGLAIAAGGDFRSGVGGIWASKDGGATWALDMDTGVEMSACDAGPDYVTCVGSAQGKKSVSVTVQCHVKSDDGLSSLMV